MLLKFSAITTLLTMLFQVGGEPAASTKTATAPKTAAVATKAKTAADELLEVEQNVVAKTNAERARYGLPPLAVDRQLVRTARAHTAWMTRNQTLTHTSAGNVAENIAMGQDSSSSVVNAWMNSSGHRANILSSSSRRIGVAAYRTPGGTIYWCQQFQP